MHERFELNTFRQLAWYLLKKCRMSKAQLYVLIDEAAEIKEFV